MMDMKLLGQAHIMEGGLLANRVVLNKTRLCWLWIHLNAGSLVDGCVTALLFS